MKKKLEYEAKRGIANFLQKTISRASFLTGMSQNTIPPNKYFLYLFQCVYNKPLLTSNNHYLGNSPNDVKPLNNVNGPLMG